MTLKVGDSVKLKKQYQDPYEEFYGEIGIIKDFGFIPYNQEKEKYAVIEYIKFNSLKEVKTLVYALEKVEIEIKVTEEENLSVYNWLCC